MKLFVRAFALSLVVTGAVASMNTGNAATSTTLVSRSSAMPVPTCPPDDPNGCGIAQLGK
jgi:hypothetical protein